MERKIGERFEYNGILLEVKESYNCRRCYFNGKGICPNVGIKGGCTPFRRADNKSVVFVPVNDGENKECSINNDVVEISVISQCYKPSTHSGYERYTLIKYKGLKFKVIYRNTSSITYGYDRDHSLWILSASDMLWHDVADYREIYPNMALISSCCDEEKHISQGDEFTRKCIEYIKLVY